MVMQMPKEIIPLYTPPPQAIQPSNCCLKKPHLRKRRIGHFVYCIFPCLAGWIHAAQAG